jgi:hypothetical protein
MSIESYVDTVQSQLAERNRRVRIAVDIVLNHAEFDDSSRGKPMGTPSARWKEDRLSESVWFSLYGHDHQQIDQAEVARDMDDRDRAVGSADFEFCDNLSTNPIAAITAMTIEIRPPNVRGYDGSPLTSPQIDGAIADLQRYEDALIAGRVDGS